VCVVLVKTAPGPRRPGRGWKATSNRPNIQAMRKTDAVARWFADRERDRIAYPLPLVMPMPEADRWYRGRAIVPDRVAYLVCLVMFSGLFIWGGIQSPRVLPLALTGAVLVGCAGTWLTVRAWRTGIGVSADYLIVRNIHRQDLIPWPSVAGFDLARPPYWHGQCLALYVICDDGRRLYTGGCSFDGWSYPRTYATARQTRQALELELRSRGRREAEASN